MDDLAALRLQIEWGADEALLDAPVDRFAAAPAVAVTVAAVTVTQPLPPRPAAPRTVQAAGDLVQAARDAAAGAGDLAALDAALDGLDTCVLRGTASRTVAPSGNPAAGLVLIGEAPGPDDDRAGIAFSGAAGERLDHVLRSAGLGRENLLLTLLVPWRPPGGRPLTEAEIAQCLPFLHRLLALTRPRRIVLMGAAPLRVLTGEQGGMRRVRGKWIEAQIPGLDGPVPALPMLPPEQWLTSPASRQATWADLLSIRNAIEQD